MDKGLFSQIVANTPLVSIDLIVCNEQGQVLLEKSPNLPAQDDLLVFGGRIRKDERIAEALLRRIDEELGCALPI